MPIAKATPGKGETPQPPVEHSSTNLLKTPSDGFHPYAQAAAPIASDGSSPTTLVQLQQQQPVQANSQYSSINHNVQAQTGGIAQPISYVQTAPAMSTATLLYQDSPQKLQQHPIQPQPVYQTLPQQTTTAPVFPPPNVQYQHSQLAQPPQYTINGDTKEANSVVHEVQSSNAQLQLQPTDQMQYAQTSEEQQKKERRAAQIAKAKHITGETCIICGKVCMITWTTIAAACSIVCCIVSCVGGGGDGGGMMGGGGGISISAPGDF